MKTVRDFITRHSRPASLPFLPEIQLYQAQEMEPLWKETETFLDDEQAEPPFWAFAWAGGQGLCRFLFDHPETVADKVVLDFASGSGLVGIAAYLCGAKKVYCCEIDPLAQVAIQMNAELNEAVLHDYRVPDFKHLPRQVDLILAGDVFYDHLMAHRVSAWLYLCVSQGKTVYVGDPGRAYKPKESTRRVTAYTVPTSLALEDLPSRDVEILELTPHGASEDSQ